MLPQTLTIVSTAFVKKVLRISENDDSIEVKNLAIKNATNPGDNYLSDIIRASVEYSYKKSDRETTEKKSLIIKVGPTEEGATKQIVSERGDFEAEIKTMTSTLTKMNELLNEKSSRLSPRVLYTEIGDPCLIVMEDLSALGYHMADRLIGLDLEHSIAAIRGLAKFHACSVALSEKDPQTISPYTDDAVTPELSKKYIVKELKAIAKALLDWPELESSARNYSEKINKLADVYYEKGLTSDELTKTDFNVLIHGDYWVNNMLFKYNDHDQIIDHIFVDFTSCWWTSPIVDIIDLFNTSLSEDVDAHYQDLLLEEYQNNLAKIMLELGCNTQPPDLIVLKETLEKNQVQTILPSFIGLGMNLTDKNNAKTIDETLQLNDYINPVYKSPAFRKRLLRRLPAWNDSGILDF